MASSMDLYSVYYSTLSPEAQERYRDKLSMLGSIADPYIELERGRRKRPMAANGDGPQQSSSYRIDLTWESWPDVGFPDIYSFLIERTSDFTRDSLKAYKSLEAYNQYCNGWVGQDCVYQPTPSNTTCIATAAVRHSQSVSAKPLSVWVAVEKNGIILCGHCTCMAGLGEACSHLAALLFTLEGNTTYRQKASCTSLPCSWLPPSLQNIQYSEISGIDFTTPKQKISHAQPSLNPSTVSPHGIGDTTEISAPHTSSQSSAPHQHSIFQPPTETDINAFYLELAGISGYKPAVLSVIPEHCEAYIPMNARPNALPIPLSSLYDSACLSISYESLLTKCNLMLPSALEVTQAHVKAVEEATRDQHKSKIWYQQRAGRITASRVKAAVSTRLNKPARSLIQAICYPESRRFYSVACLYGCQHEDTARKAYLNRMANEHTDVVVRKSGLFISLEHSFLAASPDGIMSCSCCSNSVVLEIKCPYCCKDQSFDDKAGEGSSSFCLEKTKHGIELKRNHQYYYQIQLQMYCCNAVDSDFVVWRKDEMLIKRLKFDKEFLEELILKASTFFSQCIMPELVGKIFSRDQVSNHVAANITNDFAVTDELVAVHTNDDHSEDQLTLPDHDNTNHSEWCFCKQPESFDDMVGCDNLSCSIRWYHLSCLGITPDDIPTGSWICPQCAIEI